MEFERTERTVVTYKSPQQQQQFTLDELLSEKALRLLNEQGFVCFETKDPNVSGWFFRYQIEATHREGIVVDVAAAGEIKRTPDGREEQ